MTLRSTSCLWSLGRSGFRRFSSVSGLAAGEGDSVPTGSGLASLAKAAAGIFALGGSGLGLWLMPDSSDSRLIGCSDSIGADKKPKFLLADSFRRRVFFKYEKRLRLQSPPEKIFEYFASIRRPEGEVFMSPADLMRAVVPVFPRCEPSVVREGFLREYIFFVTLLSIPDSSFSAAFKMFDLDNNGAIERDEFKSVMALMRSCNRQGACHRNGLRTGLKVRDSVENAGLVEYFFGKDGKGRLRYDKFVQFLTDLHNEILRLEFDHYDAKSEGTISAKDFALSMVASADINHINRLLDRVDDLGQDSRLKDMRISFEEFKAFADLRKRLDLLSFAIFSFGRVSGALARDDFIRATSHVCGVSLSDNVVDVIFDVFDWNRDGSLSYEEFLRVMQKREADVQQPASAGLLRSFLLLP